MYIAKNNARSQLAGTLLIADLTATLDAGEGALFAVTAPEWTYATLFDGSGNIEHVKVTARATDALTLVRAQDGTAAREWPVGTYIECRPIAAALADYAVAPQVNGATAETTIADGDELGIVDVSASNALKKITWANVKATLKTYFDTLYRVATGDVTLAAGANLVFEGSTDDGFETTVSADDPTADRSITLPDYSGAVAVRARGADIASAATVDLDAATGDIADVTGTTAVTAITLADGVEKSVRFTGILTLTNGASLVLPSAANITTAAGDVAVFRGYSAGVVRCVSYQRASGLPVVSVTPSTNDVLFYDEFLFSSSGTSRQSGLCQINGMADGRNTDSTFTFAGGGAANALWSLREKESGSFATAFLASKNPTMDIVCAQFGTGAGTRYIGMTDSAASPPANGLYFRHTNGGNYIAVARSGGVESTVDTGIAASSTMRSLKMVTTGGNSIDVQVDGVSKGTLSTNIPSAALGFYVDGGNVASTDGIKADMVRVQQSR